MCIRDSVEGAGHLAHNLLDGDGHGLGLVEDVLDGVLCHTDRLGAKRRGREPSMSPSGRMGQGLEQREEGTSRP